MTEEDRGEVVVAEVVEGGVNQATTPELALYLIALFKPAFSSSVATEKPNYTNAVNGLLISQHITQLIYKK